MRTAAIWSAVENRDRPAVRPGGPRRAGGGVGRGRPWASVPTSQLGTAGTDTAALAAGCGPGGGCGFMREASGGAGRRRRAGSPRWSARAQRAFRGAVAVMAPRWARAGRAIGPAGGRVAAIGAAMDRTWPRRTVRLLDALTLVAAHPADVLRRCLTAGRDRQTGGLAGAGHSAPDAIARRRQQAQDDEPAVVGEERGENGGRQDDRARASRDPWA